MKTCVAYVALLLPALSLVACSSEASDSNTQPLADSGSGGTPGPEASGGAHDSGGHSGGSPTAGGSGGAHDSGNPPPANDLTRANSPTCFGLADAFAAYLEERLGCSVDGDCVSVLPTLLMCVLPSLEDPDSPCVGQSVASAIQGPLLEIEARERELSFCMAPNEPEGFWSVAATTTIDGRHCRVPCAAQPTFACVSGRCEIVPNPNLGIDAGTSDGG